MTIPNSSTPIEVILIAPNISEQMGGEAIKSLHICLELERQGVQVHQIVHERVRPEVEKKFPQMRVSYIADTPLQKLLHRGRIFESAINFIFLRAAARKAEEILKQNPRAVIHFTAPTSPVLPFPHIKDAKVIIGPVNGNSYYPPAFSRNESLADKARRWFHFPAQILHRFSSSGKRDADVLLVAGGERTYQSLRMAGCREEQFVDSLDSGVDARFIEQPRITHTGVNLKFLHVGRLIHCKGTDFILRSLCRTRNRIELTIVGRGPELLRLRSLTAELKLEDRVTFIEWVANTELAGLSRSYRAFVFPSLADSNGIVVQEAMVMGLPVIALNWAGPSLLVTPETGILVSPESEETVIAGLAEATDRLAEDSALAEAMSIRGRERAKEQGYVWSDLIQRWRSIYARLSSSAKQ